MIYITIIVVAVVLCFTALLIVTTVFDRADRKEYQELKDRVTALEQTRGKSFKHSEMVDIENAIGAALKADQEVANLEDTAQIVLLQAKQARKRVDNAYQIFHTLRGRDREKPVSAPEL